MSDEEVIKRRLLIDGDGMGDERRINMLLKTFLKWCDSNESPAENKSTVDKMLAQLAMIEYSMVKSRMMDDMYQEELKNYEKHLEKTKKEIEKTEKDIVEAKLAHKAAAISMKNLAEYDVLVKAINEYPDRKELARRKNALKSEQMELKKKLNSLNEEYLDLQNKAHVMGESANQLLGVLEKKGAQPSVPAGDEASTLLQFDEVSEVMDENHERIDSP